MAPHTALQPRYNETDRTARLTDIQTKQIWTHMYITRNMCFQS